MFGGYAEEGDSSVHDEESGYGESGEDEAGESHGCDDSSEVDPQEVEVALYSQLHFQPHDDVSIISETVASTDSLGQCHFSLEEEQTSNTDKSEALENKETAKKSDTPTPFNETKTRDSGESSKDSKEFIKCTEKHKTDDSEKSSKGSKEFSKNTEKHEKADDRGYRSKDSKKITKKSALSHFLSGISENNLISEKTKSKKGKDYKSDDVIVIGSTSEADSGVDKKSRKWKGRESVIVVDSDSDSSVQFVDPNGEMVKNTKYTPEKDDIYTTDSTNSSDSGKEIVIGIEETTSKNKGDSEQDLKLNVFQPKDAKFVLDCFELDKFMDLSLEDIHNSMDGEL